MAEEEKEAHELLYEELDSLEDIEKHNEKNEKHEEGKLEALTELKRKKAKNLPHGLEMITDAVIKYKKSVGIAVDDTEETRHRIYSDVERTLKGLYRQMHRSESKGNEQLEIDVMNGLLKPLGLLVDHYNTQDLIEERSYKVEQLLNKYNEENDADVNKAIAKHHVKTKGLKWNKARINKYAIRDNIKDLLEDIAKEKLEEQRENYRQAA